MKWRNVKKRLPRIGGEYNVVWELNDGRPPVTTTMEFEFREKRWIDKQTGSNCTNEVLYWMPLPRIPHHLLNNKKNEIQT